MKYGKQWRIRLNALPIELQTKSIHYKNWKKMFRENEEKVYLFAKLAVDVEMVAKTCRMELELEIECECLTFFQLLCSQANSHDDETMYMYISLNLDTIHKLCKRWTRHFLESNNSKPVNVYNIFNKPCYVSLIRARKILELKQGTPNNTECPICFEDVKELVVTDCGHAFCQPCVKILAGMSISNLACAQMSSMLNYAHYHKPIYACPICRRVMPFNACWNKKDLVVQV